MKPAHDSASPVGTFYVPGAWSGDVELGESAAHHANVKRLAIGDVVRLTNGAGLRALASITTLAKKRLVVAVDDATRKEIPRPSHIELWAPVGDRERMLMLAEKSVELGVSAWRPVIYRRSRSVTPRGEGAAFAEKVRARQVSALEQSGGAWLPDMLPEVTIEQALAAGAFGSNDLLLDPDGERLSVAMGELVAPVRIALGPEGGLDESERAEFIRGGWRPVSIGANILRFETAAIAALAVVRTHLP